MNGTAQAVPMLRGTESELKKVEEKQQGESFDFELP
jgi:hypothetical protein